MGGPCAALVLVNTQPNGYADQNDIETITVKINGGKNVLAERIEYYGRISLVMLGYGVTEAEIKRFQVDHGLGDDGDVGPKTRGALHRDLLALSGASMAMAAFASAPVTEEKPVVPQKVEEKVKEKSTWLTWLTGAVVSARSVLVGSLAWIGRRSSPEALSSSSCS